MKHWIAWIAAIALLLSGCSFSLRDNEKIRFYYARSAYDHYGSNPVIASEGREASGHQQDLRYLISLYLMGPVDQGLKLPFPSDTRLIMISQDGEEIIITLTDNLSGMSDAAFSLGCVCLSKTAAELSGAQSVTIVSGSRTTTIVQENLLLEDTILDSDMLEGDQT